MSDVYNLTKAPSGSASYVLHHQVVSSWVSVTRLVGCHARSVSSMYCARRYSANENVTQPSTRATQRKLATMIVTYTAQDSSNSVAVQ